MADTLDDVYDSESEQTLLARLMEPRYSAMLRTVHEMVADTLRTREDFIVDDPATRRMLEHAARQVVRIDETTRQGIREQLTEGHKRGYSQWQIANGVPDEGYAGIEGLFRETWKNRALTVARNELLEAQHQSVLERYGSTGLVDRVQI